MSVLYWWSWCGSDFKQMKPVGKRWVASLKLKYSRNFRMILFKRNTEFLQWRHFETIRKLSFGMITLNLPFWFILLSQPFKDGYKDSKLYWKNPTNTLEKQFFSLYIPPRLFRRGRFSWTPCTVVINTAWSRPWKKYLGLTMVLCLFNNFWSIKVGHQSRPAQ